VTISQNGCRNPYYFKWTPRVSNTYIDGMLSTQVQDMEAITLIWLAMDFSVKAPPR
jgi:hypothetical protein